MMQRTPEWYAARLGKVTASRVADVVARLRSGDWGASRANLMVALAVERLTGTPQEAYTSPAMQHGIDCEPQARAAYEFYRDLDVEPVGFVDHPAIAWSGASPDGLINKDGLVEFKCPTSQAHVSFLLEQKIEDRYTKQIAWQLACTGRVWCDLAYFDPRMPPEMQLHVIRVWRHESLICDLEKEVPIFLDEVAETVAKLRARYQPIATEAAA